MPCRMDDMPVSSHAYDASKAEVAKLKKAGDKLQADLCALGEYMADILYGRKTIEEVKSDPAVIKLMAQHVKHRRKDRDRYIDVLSTRLKAAKTTETKDRLLKTMTAVAMMEDKDILDTDLF